MSALTARYEEGLHEALLDPAEAAAYLNAALTDGDVDGFLLALRDVAESQGLPQAARLAGLNRESLYPLFGVNRSQLSTLDATLRSLGLRLAIEVSPPSILQPTAM